MDFDTSKNRLVRDGRYGRGWLIIELLLFLALTLFTGGVFFLMFLLSNLCTPPAGSDECAYPWEARNHAGNVRYSTTLRGRWAMVMEKLWRKASAGRAA